MILPALAHPCTGPPGPSTHLPASLSTCLPCRPLMFLKLCTCATLLLVLFTAAATLRMDAELLQWKSSGPWPEFPDHLIPCPLEGEQLNNTYYSLERVQEAALEPGQPYHEQNDALGAFLTDPPLTKNQLGKRVRMAGIGATSIAIRRQELSKFVGFLVMYLHQLPNMQHVMQPQLVAKYLGFLKARGLEWSSIKKVGARHALGGLRHARFMQCRLHCMG